MLVDKTKNEAIIEADLKEKLAYKCMNQVKSYIKDKEKKYKTKQMVSLARKLIYSNRIDYNYSFLVTLLLCYEYESIKEKVTSGSLSLKEMSNNDYWDRHSKDIGKVEAIFFTYTYVSEIYPQIIDVISDIEKSKDGEQVISRIFEVLEQES